MIVLSPEDLSEEIQAVNVIPVSQNQINPRKTAPGVKHVRPPAVFAAIVRRGADVFFAHLRKISPGGAIFFNDQLHQRKGQHDTLDLL